MNDSVSSAPESGRCEIPASGPGVPEVTEKRRRNKRLTLRWWLKELPAWGITMLVVLAVVTVLGQLRAPEVVGTTPDFALLDLDGNTVYLEDFRGRRVLINVWATWCPPCRVELPSFARFARRHPEIQVLGLVAQSPRPDVERIAEGLPYPNFLLDEAGSRQLKVVSLPSSYLLDEKGRIIRAHAGLLWGPQLWWMTR